MNSELVINSTRKGVEILKYEFLELKLLSDKYIALYSKSGWAIYHINGKRTGEEIFFEEILEVANGRFFVKSEGSIHWLNGSGKVLGSFDQYIVLPKELLATRSEGRWQILDAAGRIAIEKTFSAYKKESGKELFQSGSKWFYVNSQGNHGLRMP